MKLEGKVAIVTGSTRGIGEGIARRLASEGAAVIVSGIDAEDGERVAQKIGEKARFVKADMRRADNCNQLIQIAVDEFGRLDILVNNAGIFPSVPLADMTPELWDEIFAVNVRGVFQCCQPAIPIMQRQGGGSIINIGSTLAYNARIDRLAYAASKAALLSITRTLARAYLAEKIRVNWITVGWVASPGEIELRNAQFGDGQAFLDEQSRNKPLGRLETPEDIAAGVAFLASDDASHITGCELNISGGLLI
jgi:NAD(P)-dependent dehydrogenase (short-subunit alcohol dehydrogenase family)